MQIEQTDIHSPDYPSVLLLRDQVLRIPLGRSLQDEDLSGDAQDIILVAREGPELLGCLMLHPMDEKTLKLRQMAVLPQKQRSGIGRALVEAAERLAWTSGYAHLILHAREVAAGFYLQMGYRQEGPLFMEVGIPHILMLKDKV